MNPGRFKMAIKGTPTFPMSRLVQGLPSKGVSWLVFIGVLSIFSKKKTNYEFYKKPIVERKHHYQKIPKYQTRKIEVPSKGNSGMIRA